MQRTLLSALQRSALVRAPNVTAEVNAKSTTRWQTNQGVLGGRVGVAAMFSVAPSSLRTYTSSSVCSWSSSSWCSWSSLAYLPSAWQVSAPVLYRCDSHNTAGGVQSVRRYAKKGKRKGGAATGRVMERGEPGSAAATRTQNKAGEGVVGTNTCTLEGVSKMVGTDRWLFRDVSLGLYQGAKVGVLGVNGAGKSSLLRVIAGEDQLYDGDVRVPDGVRIGYLPQEPRLDEERNVYENVVSLVRGDPDGLLLQLHAADEEVRSLQQQAREENEEEESARLAKLEAAQTHAAELKKLLKKKKLLKVCVCVCVCVCIVV
jgi:ABC transporter